MTTTAPVRWGILATGSIADKFAADLALVPDNELAAVGSRRLEAAQEFAARHGAARAHGSYEELVNDPGVDVIYVATPHGRHLLDVRLCFEAGKNVLCEKALTLNADDSAALVADARRHGVFFAEAMWARTNPNVRRLREVVAAGAIGDVLQVRAELGFVAPTDKARLWDPALGASALLDVGIYPLSFVHMLLGEPETIAAAGVLSDQGIDISGGATLTYASGAVASIAWTQVAQGDNTAVVAGPAGSIRVPGRFHEAHGFTLVRGDERETTELPVTGRGYAHEIEEVAACLRAGLTESPLLPLDETVSIQRQMDEILRQLGVAAR
ncbi:Gfo/Idh/MocA family protein [Aeromicrobium wangtongii]|uniref:Gfo/Idh/MocA family protein n=1 Tax=Aeromicrobium wangtongii TaxID=2969247 RepID=UPI00201781C8|nr:Gfo/Idh/MocA family oxidoreductase [Aeromicrobium wangtongii]MCL3817709.1 Gfo/Idh/MocA family oxidoreductase [Aeromicrobium wangtongii]